MWSNLSCWSGLHTACLRFVLHVVCNLSAICKLHSVFDLSLIQCLSEGFLGEESPGERGVCGGRLSGDGTGCHIYVPQTLTQASLCANRLRHAPNTEQASVAEISGPVTSQAGPEAGPDPGPRRDPCKRGDGNRAWASTRFPNLLDSQQISYFCNCTSVDLACDVRTTSMSSSDRMSG